MKHKKNCRKWIGKFPYCTLLIKHGNFPHLFNYTEPKQKRDLLPNNLFIVESSFLKKYKVIGLKYANMVVGKFCHFSYSICIVRVLYF